VGYHRIEIIKKIDYFSSIYKRYESIGN